MSEDQDFDMEVVEEDEPDELGADGASSPEEEFRSEASREESDTGANETDDAESISSRAGSVATDSDREVFGLGSVPEEWNISSLPSVVEIEMGSSPPSSTYNEQEEGLPFYQGNADFGHMTPKVSTWCSDPVKTADEDDVLISIRAPVGDLNIADEHCCIGRGLAALRPDEVNGLYLFYGLAQRSRWLSRLASGSTFKSVSSADLEKVDLPVPPLPEQRKIASVLYAVDQAIQKTEAIIEQENKIFEGAKRDLLRNGYFEHSRRQNTATGSYPNEWRVARGDEVFSLRSGEFLDSSKRKENGRYPVYGGNGIMGYTDQSRVPEGTVVIGRVGAYCGNVHITASPAWVTDNAILVEELSSAVKPGFLVHVLDEVGLNRFAEQSAQPRISQSTLRNLKIPIPSEEEQEKIVDSLRTMKEATESEMRYQNDLQLLKKGLMQDLLTGEVRTADKAIEVLDEIKAHG